VTTIADLARPDPTARLEPQTGNIPILRVSPITKPFWEGVDRHELRYQRCAACGTPIFNPAHVCRVCSSADLEWQVSEGVGTVYSWTVCHRPMTPDFVTPYAPVIVDLDEGYQMLSNLVGCTVADVRVGLRVAVLFHPVVKDRTLPYFRPLAES
jgi:uncharacterized OB-fold protein